MCQMRVTRGLGEGAAIEFMVGSLLVAFGSSSLTVNRFRGPDPPLSSMAGFEPG